MKALFDEKLDRAINDLAMTLRHKVRIFYLGRYPFYRACFFHHSSTKRFFGKCSPSGLNYD
jgi:hypothetical protein